MAQLRLLLNWCTLTTASRDPVAALRVFASAIVRPYRLHSQRPLLNRTEHPTFFSVRRTRTSATVRRNRESRRAAIRTRA